MSFANKVVRDYKHLQELIDIWKREQPDNGAVFFKSSPVIAQPCDQYFFLLDSITSISFIKHPCMKLDPFLENAPMCTVMRLYGTVDERCETATGSGAAFNSQTANHFSICVNVHGFMPSFYALPTVVFPYFSIHFQSTCRLFGIYLNDLIRKKIIHDDKYSSIRPFYNNPKAVAVKLTGIPLSSVVGCIYNFPLCIPVWDGRGIIKIQAALQVFVELALEIIRNLADGFDAFGTLTHFRIFGAEYSNNVRFLTEKKIMGASWIALRGGNYYLRDADGSENVPMENDTQFEVDVHECCLNRAGPLVNTMDHPPFRVLSFDIETRYDDGIVVLGKEPTYQIGIVLQTIGNSGTRIIGKAVITRGSCDPLNDATVIPVTSSTDQRGRNVLTETQIEAKMLAYLRKIIVDCDPDFLAGYNNRNFDFPQLMARTESVLKNEVDALSFRTIGRLTNASTVVKTHLGEEEMLHIYDMHRVKIPGRIVLDLYPLYQRHEAVRNLRMRLKDVAERHIAKKKIDLPYTKINDYQAGTSSDRRLLAEYCLTDAEIPLELMMNKPPNVSTDLNFYEYYIQLSRLSGTPLRHLFNKPMRWKIVFERIMADRNRGRTVVFE